MPHRATIRVLSSLALVAGTVPTALRAQRSGDVDRWVQECRDGARDYGGRPRFCEVRDTGFRATGRAISVDPGENGGVSISAWDRDSVAVSARIQAQGQTEADARSLAQQVRIETSDGTVRADGPATSHRSSWSVSFVLLVPRRTDLTAEAVNGPIEVEGVKGRMQLTTRNGPVHLTEVGGDVHARTTNGPLVVTLAGDRWDGTGLDSETENGPVTLTLPANYAAHLVTGTVNGPLSIDFPITVQGLISRHNIETDLNGGGPAIRAVTTNGPLAVRRR